MPFIRYRREPDGRIERVRSKQDLINSIRTALKEFHFKWPGEFEVAFWRHGEDLEYVIVEDRNDWESNVRIAEMQRDLEKMRFHPRKVIRQKRTQLKLTQKQLAAQTNMSREHLNRVERGRRRLSLRDAHALASALDLPLEELTALIERPPKEV